MGRPLRRDSTPGGDCREASAQVPPSQDHAGTMGRPSMLSPERPDHVVGLDLVELRIHLALQ
jgi:hypothetical protein